MSPKRPATALFLLVLGLPLAALGDESQIPLKDAPGKDLIVARCAICHSLDYIPMNAPFLDSLGWAKELDKMIGFGAPVSEGDRPVLLRYLHENYGH